MGGAIARFSDWLKMKSRARGRSARYWLAIVAMAGLALLLTVLGFVKSGSSTDAWFEVGKAGVQLGVITIVGALIGWAVNGLQDERAARNREVDFRIGLLRDLAVAYQQSKGVRRRLRSYGFRRPGDGWASASILTAEQSIGFRAEMGKLVEAQLAIEKTRLEVEQQERLFDPHTERIKEEIHKAESYINHVIEDWEGHGVEIVVGAKADEVLFGLANLQAFLGEARAPALDAVEAKRQEKDATIGGFVESVSGPLELIGELFRSLLP